MLTAIARLGASSWHTRIVVGVDILRNLLLVIFVYRLLRSSFVIVRGYGPIGALQLVIKRLRAAGYRFFLGLPGVKSKVREQVRTAITGLEAKLLPTDPKTVRFTSLPAEGWTVDRVRAELRTLSDMKRTRWEEGRVSGAVYHGGRDLSTVQTEAFDMFGVANPIHPDVFPGVRKMEAEVVSMVLALFNAPQDAAGVTTSGGSESIIMAVLAAREKARVERGVTSPEMILPETAHTAFRKAAEYFKITIRQVPCPAPSYQSSISHTSRLINSNTILLVGSAPNFPHGIIDNIPALSALATKHSLPLHVDCCLGSFLMPFLSRAGFPLTEAFDFRLPGVTSISVDTHKYGFAPKGNSVVLYRSATLRRYQYFISADWSGGVYASPSMAGSRPGALIAGCWASLVSVGEDGYADSCKTIVGSARGLVEAIRTRPGLSRYLSVMGKPMVSVVAFRSDRLDIYDVADAMSAKGWHLNALQDPPAMHVAVTLPVAAATEDLLRDLEDVVTELAAREAERAAQGGDAKGAAKGDAAALYGVAGSLPDKTIVKDLAAGFLDTLYKV